MVNAYDKSSRADNASYVKYALISRLNKTSNSFQKDFESHNFLNLSETVKGLNDDIGEIIADCDQNDLVRKIYCSINEMANLFEE